jgi:hypothetical protein
MLEPAGIQHRLPTSIRRTVLPIHFLHPFHQGSAGIYDVLSDYLLGS